MYPAGNYYYECRAVKAPEGALDGPTLFIY
jgi:hypothetical protein